MSEVGPEAGREIERNFVRIAEGQVHYRTCGGADGGAAPLIMLHAAPYSARTLEPLMREIAKSRRVIAPDLPGTGDSEPLAQAAPNMQDYADALGRTLEALEIESADIYGAHTGGTVGTELAIAQPRRVRRLIIDGIGLYTPEFQAEIVANYAPEIEPDQIGSQIHWAWHFVRDHSFFFPWYMRDAGHRSPGGLASADALHDNVVDLLKNIRTYHHAFRATFSHPKRERLAQVKVPTLFIGRAGAAAVEEAAGLVPGSELAILPAGADPISAKGQMIERFLSA
jgi:pimeloyl-ACP methyl ester carboxylesterase